MAYRYTNTDKWSDSWFLSLKPLEKLLFDYLCDNCDIAGFIEINTKIWAVQIGTNIRGLEGALKGLQRGLFYSKENDCLYVLNFLKHQKNLPLNPAKNMSHRGIIKRFDLFSYKFDQEEILKIKEGALKGLASPYGNGNGNDILEEGGSGGKHETDRKIRSYTYDQIVKRSNESGKEIWDYYKPVKFPQHEKPVWVHIDDIKRYKLQIFEK